MLFFFLFPVKKIFFLRILIIRILVRFNPHISIGHLQIFPEFYLCFSSLTSVEAQDLVIIPCYGNLDINVALATSYSVSAQI